MEKEKYFWADEMADRILKAKSKKNKFVCASGVTPSGTIHIGHFREVITAELVVRALKHKGHKVKFIYSWDDFDRFRKVPANIPKEYSQYIGMPVSQVPSPEPKDKKSYAEFFEKQFEKSAKVVGIYPEFIRQSKMYEKCKYAELIKTAIDNTEKIKQILNKYRKEPLTDNWQPLEVYCTKCKKDFTKIIKLEEYEIEYECKCGNKEKTDFRKIGNVKLSWRVDWPMRWKYEAVDFEPGGIDHSVEGGSFTTAKEIVKIFGHQAPLYQLYEWIRPKGGVEFASSVGNVITLEEVSEIYEPEVLRFLFVRTRPNKGFQISFDEDIIKTYDEYDVLEKKYYDKTATEKEKRIYELSQIKLKSKKPERESFRHLSTLTQIGKTKKLNTESKNRAEKVKKWLEKFAPEEFKFELQTRLKPDLNLTEKQKSALKMLKEFLTEKKPSEEELYNEFYNISKKTDLKTNEFFEASYKTIIGKPKGPRLASLIIAIDKDKIIKLLQEVK